MTGGKRKQGSDEGGAGGTLMLGASGGAGGVPVPSASGGPGGIPMPGANGGAGDIPRRLCPNLGIHAVNWNLQKIQELSAADQANLIPHTLIVFSKELEDKYKKWIWNAAASANVKILQNAVNVWNLTHHGLNIKGDEKTCERVVFLIFSGNRKKGLLEKLTENAGNPEDVTKTLLEIAAYLSQQKVRIRGCKCAKRMDKLEPGQCKEKGAKRQGKHCPCSLSCGRVCLWTCYSVGGSLLLQDNLRQIVFEILGKNPWTEQPPQGGVISSMIAHTVHAPVPEYVPAPPVPDTPDQEESAPQVPDTTGSPQKNKPIASGSSEDLLVTTEKPSDILKPPSPSQSIGEFEEDFGTEPVELSESLLEAACAFTSKEPKGVSVTPSSRGLAFR